MKRYFPHVARVLLALPLLISGLNKLMHFFPQIPPTPAAAAYFGALYNTGYMLPFIALTEIAVAVALLANLFVPLALVVLAPLTVNILAFHLFMVPAGLPVAVGLVALQIALAWHHRAVFAPLLSTGPKLPERVITIASSQSA